MASHTNPAPVSRATMAKTTASMPKIPKDIMNYVVVIPGRVNSDKLPHCVINQIYTRKKALYRAARHGFTTTKIAIFHQLTEKITIKNSVGHHKKLTAGYKSEASEVPDVEAPGSGLALIQPQCHPGDEGCRMGSRGAEFHGRGLYSDGIPEISGN